MPVVSNVHPCIYDNAPITSVPHCIPCSWWDMESLDRQCIFLHVVGVAWFRCNLGGDNWVGDNSFRYDDTHEMQVAANGYRMEMLI